MARLDTVDFRLLRVFSAVVEARGFSAAQTTLNVNTSTISNQISALETRLGVKLCQRGRAGFKLTEDGATIFSEAQRLFSAIDGFDMRASALRAKVRGTLNIGILDNTITDPQAKLDHLFRQFTAAMGDVQLNIEVKSPNELLRDVQDGKLHAVIGSFPRILLGLTYVKLYEEAHFFYCAARHPLFSLNTRQITQDLLAGHRFVTRGYWGARDTKHLRTDRARASVNNMEAAARLILSGDYLGYLPEHYARRWVQEKVLKPLLPLELTYLAPFEVVFDPTKQNLPSLKMFLEITQSVFGGEAA